MASIIKDTFYKRTETALKNPSHSKEIIRIISKYVDRNTDALVTLGPVNNIVFFDSDRIPIYEILSITKDELVATIKKSSDVSKSVNASDPFNVAMTLMIRYFCMTNKDAERKACALYLLLSMYPSLFAKYFKFKPNENIMSYTISSMSNKFKIKQKGTMLSVLDDVVSTCDNHYTPELKRFTDKDVATYIMAIKTRVNSILKNICNEFMKHHRAGNYINYEEDNMDEDNFTVADSNSLLIRRVTDAVTLQIAVHGPEMRCVSLAAKMCKVSVNAMRTAVTQLCKESKNKAKITELVSDIMYDFLFNETNTQQDIKSTKFTLYALNTYKKSNTSNNNILKIKAILDEWLTEYSEQYKKTNVQSTINNFRRALYMFWVFTIQRTRI